jgi:Protein of unknown function (DUF429)
LRVAAVDWSGRAAGAERYIWLAEVRDGRLVELRNGLSREAIVAGLVEDPPDVMGLDFAFSFPAWWCAERGWSRVVDVWTAARDEGEAWLAACEPPFWGRPAKRRPADGEPLRRTEREDARGAKSVFQIGGAGAVGTGSIRGMPHLLTLAEAGFAVWPFSAGRPLVVEIYPRALTGPLRKSRRAEREAALERFRGDQPATLLARAAGSEDAFDAAVSALVMARHADQLAALEPTSDRVHAIEGRVWRPRRHAVRGEQREHGLRM